MKNETTKFDAAAISDSHVLSRYRVIWYWDIEANYWANKNPAAKPDAQNQSGSADGGGYDRGIEHEF